MPTYLYRCECCENETEGFNRVAERHTRAPECGKNATHGKMAIKLVPTMLNMAADVHYICPLTSRQVTSHRQRNNIMRERNVVDARDAQPEQGLAKAVEKAASDQAHQRQMIKDIRKDLTTGQDRPFTEKQLNSLIPHLEQV